MPTAKNPTDASAELNALGDLALRDPAKGESAYKAFIETHKKDLNPKVQDQVGEARIRTAYLDANRKDFGAARAVLLEAAQQYRGTGINSSDFGGIKDGAEYQAAVCLFAEGKKKEARAAFTEFLKKEPASPLAKGAYRRLVMLNNGVSRPEDEALINKAVAVQEKKANLDRVSCGPRSIQILLKRLGKPAPSVEQLAKLCSTGKDGTSMLAVHDALKRLGLASYGVRVNRADFLHVAVPAIMLTNEHYVVITQITPTTYTYIDPVTASQDEVTLSIPSEDKPFLATLLVLSPPQLGGR